MPHFPTRSNLLRRASQAATPPICKSKDDPTGIISTCDCPDCDNCQDIEFFDGEFDAMMTYIDDTEDVCGSWVWDGDEDNPPDSGEFNNCIPPGEGNGAADIYECSGVFSGTFPANNVTYPQWIALLQQNFVPGWYWTGTWTNISTGEVFPTNGSGCPP